MLLDELSDSVIFIGIGSVLIFFIGLIDDIISISPIIKLLTQIIIAVGAYIFGVQFFSIAPDYISFPLTILWIVGIINAMNLLDNMDGLCSGITAIITLVIAMGSYLGDNILLMQLCLIITGICLGFLVFNFYPAKIFLVATPLDLTISFSSTNLVIIIEFSFDYYY